MYQSNENQPVNENQAINPGSDQKGESHPIVRYIRELLDNREWRAMFYSSLIILSIFPILVDTVDLFNKGVDKYTGNEFCNGEMECSIALAGIILMVISIFVLVRTILYDTFSAYVIIKKNIAVSLLFIGNSFLFITILIMTFKSDGDTKNLNVCFVWATTDAEKKLCHVQYFGTQIIYPLLIYCAVVDFANIWDELEKKKYLLNRLIWFSSALLISSFCTVINLIGNNKIYQRHVLANTSFFTCTFGYCFLVLTASLSIIIQCNCFANWRTERSATRVLGYMTLLAVLLIQSRTFADLFVFCCMCLMMAADIQVVKET
eukprot:61556_1